MADQPNIPSLSGKVDPEVKRAFVEVRSWFSRIGRLISDAELTKTGVFARDEDGVLTPTTTPAEMRAIKGHVAIVDGNPHGTDHSALDSILGLDVTATDTVKDRHVSNAQGKAWQDHMAIVDGNPHGTDHDMLGGVAVLDPASSNTTQDRHLSDAQAKVWQDHTEDTVIHHAPASPSPDAATTAAGTAGATYTSAEQALINALVADVATLRNSLNDLKGQLRATGVLSV